MTEYKLCSDWIGIEYVPDEHEEANDFKPSFWFENNRHFLKDYIRTHNNPWVNGEWPDYIHGFEAEEYYHPLYIEINDSGDAVRIYKEV